MKKNRFIGVLALPASWLCAAIPSTPGWHQIPNTRLADVGACENGYSYACGSTTGGVLAWSSGLFDTLRNRMIVWGGGHGDYRGNEIYALNMNDLTLKMITVPGSPVATTCQEAIANGTQPNSRHTYDGICYLANQDRLFAFGGSLACGPGNWSAWTWTFSFATMTWRNMQSGGDIPIKESDLISDYDPNSGKVFLNDRQHLYNYNPLTNKYTRLSSNDIQFPLGTMSVIDPKRKKYVYIGGGSARIWDISEGSSYAIQALNTTGGSAIVSSESPGLAYDPLRDRITAWNGGNTVYSLNLDTRQWSAATYANGPGSPALNIGTFKRWRYCKSLDVFVLVNNYGKNAFAFRFPPVAAERRLPASNDFDVSAAPNPFCGGVTLTVGAENFRARISDPQGRTLRRWHGERLVVWNTDGLGAGVYLLTVETRDRTVTRKLLFHN